MKTRKVYLTYTNCSGEEFAMPGACLLTIRIRDAQGLPLAGVQFEAPNHETIPSLETQFSDDFGRIFRFLRYGQTLSGQLVKEGYAPKVLTEQCHPGESFEKELFISLDKK
jgi:hypothetical protein